MITVIESAASAIATTIILLFCLTMAAHLDRHKWVGQLGEFAVYSASIALLGAGSLGLFLGYHHAAPMILVGIAGLVASDRRKI